MASTSVHFPKGLLEELDQLATERGVSRNRLIVESCRLAVGSFGQWPEGFFSNDHLDDEDLAELSTSCGEFAKMIASSRRSRHASSL